MLDPREDRGSSLDPRLERDCQLTLARYCREGGREVGREVGREGGREIGREGGREGGR